MADAGQTLPDDADVVPIRGEDTDADAAEGGDLATRTLLSLLPETEAPIIGPVPDGEPQRGTVATPRLSRHVITLADGHRVGVAVSGMGVPLVLVHGFTAEGFLYAQTLSRLVAMGFKVIAIDTAHHGSTQGLPSGGANFAAYADLLGRVLDELGIERTFFAGHSMGGRVVAQLCGNEPERALGVILIDAIVGETWDRLVDVGRVFPPAMAGVVLLLALDAITTPPFVKNPEQAMKLGKLFLPTLLGHASRPWRMLGPAVSILRSRGSRWMLQRLAQEQVPVVAIHGTRDFAVPFRTAKDAATRSRGQFVVIDGANHCWPLRDPETLPAIMAELLQGPLGVAYRDAVRDLGLDPDTATIEEVEERAYEADAAIREMTPALEFADVTAPHREPSYTYSIEPAKTLTR